MSNVSRNDPCPCGSGRKYKKCCMDKRKTQVSLNKFSWKGKLMYLGLICILIFSVFSRYRGYDRPHTLTFDEVLYSYKLANQLSKNLTDYSGIPAYEEVKKAKRPDTPEYLNRPLFKHPPLFPYFIAFNYSLFGASMRTAVGVSIFFGTLMVLGVFFLGKILYDERVGILAAFLLCLDPVLWLSSEKIWMETTMSFFILLSIIFFVLSSKNKMYMIFSAISIGLAMLTKYPGVLAFFIIISFVFFTERKLLKDKTFWLFCILPFLVFSPWIIWNYKVYGSFTAAFVKPHEELMRFITLIIKDKLILAISIAFAALPIVVWSLAKVFYRFGRKITITPIQKRLLAAASIVITFGLAIFFPVMRDILKNSVFWQHTFTVGWINPFYHEPMYFYLKRLPELSPLYIMSFLAIFLIFLRNRKDLFLIWVSLWLVGFFTLWKNYQCRYILPAVPFLLLLSARVWVWLFERLLKREGVEPGKMGAWRGFIRIASTFVLFAVISYFIARTIKTDLLLAIPNNFAYF